MNSHLNIPEGYQPPTDDLRSGLRQALKIPLEAFVWCYKGSGGNSDLLPETIALLGQLHKDDPRHFGFFITNKSEELRKMCAQAGLPLEAYCIGAGKREDVIRWMVAGDAAILLEENAMTFADYLLAGLPVLLTDNRSDISRWVRERASGEVALALNPDHLYGAALKLAKRVSVEGRPKLREKSRKLFYDFLSVTRTPIFSAGLPR